MRQIADVGVLGVEPLQRSISISAETTLHKCLNPLKFQHAVRVGLSCGKGCSVWVTFAEAACNKRRGTHSFGFILETPSASAPLAA